MNPSRNTAIPCRVEVDNLAPFGVRKALRFVEKPETLDRDS